MQSKGRKHLNNCMTLVNVPINSGFNAVALPVEYILTLELNRVNVEYPD